jgi:hypothetical protein
MAEGAEGAADEDDARKNAGIKRLAGELEASASDVEF